MTLYGYVPNKQALDSLVTDHILSQVHVPGTGTWEQRLHGLLCAARSTLVERPELTDGAAIEGSAIDLLLRGELGREATRLANEVTSLLNEGPFRPADVDICFSALFTYVTGHTDTNTSTTSAPQRSGRTHATPRPTDAFGAGLTALIEGLKLTLGTAAAGTGT